MENNQNHGKEATITLYDTLGPDAANGHELARQVWAAETAGCTRLHVRINSAGGSVVHGYSLFAALRHSRMTVHTHLDGLALSMAGLIFLAGQVRHFSPWGLLMLHDPALAPPAADAQPAEPGLDPDDEGAAHMLTRIRASLLEMYAGCTRLTRRVLSEMMGSETWLTASDALRLGLATLPQGQRLAERYEARLHLQLENCPTPTPRYLAQAVAQCRPHFDEDMETESPLSPQPAAPMPIVNAPRQQLLSDLLAQAPADARAAWNFRDWERKDPAGLNRLRMEAPGRFEALFAECYQHGM